MQLLPWHLPEGAGKRSGQPLRFSICSGDVAFLRRYQRCMTETADLLHTLTICETQVWQALVAGDAQADAAALDAAFLGVYPDGFAGKADHVGQVSNGPTIASYHLSGLRVLPLGAEHAVLSYYAAFHRVGQNTPEAMYVSSIWRQTAKGWVNIFSQDTPAAELPNHSPVSGSQTE